MDLGLVGRAATAATELRGRFLIAGLLRTAARGLSVVLSLRIRGRGAAAAARGADNKGEQGGCQSVALQAL
jgi:hypothetical protein